MALSMSASDDIEKSVEASLEEFVNQANAAFAEDFDGWDIAQTTAEVRFFMEGKKQQEEASKQAQEAIKLQQVKPVAPVAIVPSGTPLAESTAIVKPLPSPGGAAGSATRQRQAVETRAIKHEDKTVPTAKLPADEGEADKTVPQPKVASAGMSKGFLFATMLGAFLVGAAVVLFAVKFFFMQPPPAVVIQPAATPAAAPAAAPSPAAAAAAPAPAAAEPAAPAAAPAPAPAPEPAVAAKEPPKEPEPKAEPEPKTPKKAAVKAAPKAAAPKAAAPKPAAAKPAAAPKPAAVKPAAPAKPKKKTKGAGELIDVF